MSSGDIVEFKLQEGAAIIDEGILKLTKYLEGGLKDEFEFCVNDYVKIYRTVYKMCTQKPPHNYTREVYDKYKESIEEYITQKVLPSLKLEGHDDELMLRELVKIWENYELMLRFLSNMFYYLDRYFVRNHSDLPALREVGIKCFHELVYLKISVALKNAVIKVINREREGEQIDRALLKTGVNIFVENGMDFYKSDYEVPMLEETGSYYSKKAASWISEISCSEYMLKAEQCLTHEMDIIGHYLHSSSVHNLLEKVQNELLSSKKMYLLENVSSLLWDDKREDLSRMYRLFCHIPEGLKSLANNFEQYVTRHGLKLVDGAYDAVVNNDEHGFVGKVVQLHGKFRCDVKEVFQNNDIFQKALNKAFRVICNKEIAGITSAELFATFYDKLLRTGGIENTDSEMAANLLHYLDDKDIFQDFCIKKLAHRLLLDKYSNVDNEMTLVSKIKSELGEDFTKWMERMLNDFNKGENFASGRRKVLPRQQLLSEAIDEIGKGFQAQSLNNGGRD